MFTSYNTHAQIQKVILDSKYDFNQVYVLDCGTKICNLKKKKLFPKNCKLTMKRKIVPFGYGASRSLFCIYTFYLTPPPKKNKKYIGLYGI